jgi:hypothetical protein
MADRALIIAVENYPDATSGFTAKTLPGTLAAAEAFRTWLEDKWAREQMAGTVYFCSEPRVPGGRGATELELKKAILDLDRDGRNTTDNLYVYFSGHGFRLAGETLNLADVIVTSDFIDTDLSAGCCWKLSALVDRLRCLGHGCHFYFIDACRNEITHAIGSGIMPVECQGVEDPSVFVVQSTVPGAPALVGGPFAQGLVAGLKGAGIAKTWQPPMTDAMQVRFDSLFDYLKEALAETQPLYRDVKGQVRDSEVIFDTLRPVPTCTLNVVVRTTLPDVAGTVTLARYRGDRDVRPLTGTQVSFDVEPDHYTVSLDVNAGTVTPARVPVRLYDDATVTFDVGPGGARGAPPTGGPPGDAGGPSGTLRIAVPADATVMLQHVTLGVEASYAESTDVVLPAGAYAVSLRGRDGRLIRQAQVVVDADRTTDVAPSAWRGSLPHESIAARLPQVGGGVDFSEELQGPVTDPDLGVWLAIVGGGRILGSQGDYSKIGPLPLADFSNVPPGGSPVYVLAGFADRDLSLAALMHPAAGEPRWIDIRAPAGLDGLHEGVYEATPGPAMVTLKVGEQPALTLATFVSPNRCTLIVLTLDEERQPRIAQYLVPLGHLISHLDPEVRANIEDRRLQGIGPLWDIRQLAAMHRAFRQRRDLAKASSEQIFEELLYAKWVDPIGASLAAYECVRRNQRGWLPIVAGNMERYFPDLPDTAAILRLAGLPSMPRGVPLFVDGVRRFTGDELTLPFDAGLLDFGSPWTTWRGVVRVERA